jgi:integrase
MPRMVRPWYRVGRGQWYARVNQKQVPLGVFDPGDEDAALAALRKLIAKAQQNTPPEAPVPDWPALVREFIRAKEARQLAPRTVEDYRKHLTFALAHFGTLRPAELFAARAGGELPHCPRVEESTPPTWKENSRRNYLAAVETFLRWCGHRVSLDKPGRESAGAGMVIEEAVYWQAVGAARGDLRPLLVFLWNTGCRPSEAARLTAADVDWSSGTITLRRHKTRRGAKGKARVIYLSPAAVEVLSAQRDRHPAGLLFPNRRGTAWRDKALAQAVWRVSRKIGHRVTAYGCRHSYCTRALAKGLPDAHVAALMGHGSTRMIHQHYSHLSQQSQLLKDAAAKV